MTDFSLVSQFSPIPPFRKPRWGGDVNETVAEFNAGWTSHLAFLRKRFRVGIIGEFDAGKSTLNNSLVGEPILAVSKAPETAGVQILSYPGPTHRPHPKGAGLFLRPEDSAFRFGLELWDTPGTNAELKHHEKIATRTIPQLDHLIVALRATDAVTRTRKELLETIRETMNPHANLSVVLTYFDVLVRSSLDPAEPGELVTETRKFLGLDRDPWRIDARNLAEFDGPDFVGWIRDATISYSASQLLRELTSPSYWIECPTKTHWLWTAIAQGMSWPTVIPRELQSDEIQVLVDDWAETCRNDRRALAKVDPPSTSAFFQRTWGVTGADLVEQYRDMLGWFMAFIQMKILSLRRAMRDDQLRILAKRK